MKKKGNISIKAKLLGIIIPVVIVIILIPVSYTHLDVYKRQVVVDIEMFALEFISRAFFISYE